MKSYIWLIALLLSFYSTPANSSENCDAVLIIAGRDIIKKFETTLNEYNYSSQYCSEYSSQKNQSGSLNIGIPTGNGTFVSIGGGGKSEKAIASAFCEKTDISSKDQQYLKTFLDIVNPEAVSAWLACERLTTEGLKFSIDEVGSSFITISVGFSNVDVKSVQITGGAISGASCTGQLMQSIENANDGKKEELVLESGGPSKSMICTRKKKENNTNLREELAAIITFSNMNDFTFNLSADSPPAPYTPHCSKVSQKDTRSVFGQSGMSGPNSDVMCDDCGICNYPAIHVFGANINIDSACIIDIKPGPEATKGFDCGRTPYFRQTTYLSYYDNQNKVQQLWLDGDCQSLKNRFQLEQGCE